MTALAALVIVAAIPFAVVDTIMTGRVYLLSGQFLGIHREAWCPLNRKNLNRHDAKVLIGLLFRSSLHRTGTLLKGRSQISEVLPWKSHPSWLFGDLAV